MQVNTTSAGTVTLAGTVKVTSNLPFVADMNRDGTADTPIESVVPLGTQFQVNTFTANPQIAPSVGMDENGNFTIAWQSEAQGLSFFNSIEAQRFDRDGNRLGNEFAVTTDPTTLSSANLVPDVAMADDGTIAITWTNTDDPTYVLDFGYTGSILATVYNAQGAVLKSNIAVGGGGNSTVAFDSGDHFTIAWEELTPSTDDNTTPLDSMSDVFGQEYQLYDATGALNFATLRPTFRVNSATPHPQPKEFLAQHPNGGPGGHGCRRRHDVLLRRLRSRGNGHQYRPDGNRQLGHAGHV